VPGPFTACILYGWGLAEEGTVSRTYRLTRHVGVVALFSSAHF
jgi:hypothetical protein